MSSVKHVNILGTRGIPAAHGGFETFAERLAKHLKHQGWDVTVYCQSEHGSRSYTDIWQGIERIHINPLVKGTLGTIEFDMRSVLDAIRRPGIDLVLGYNTAIFSIVPRLFGRAVVINMDGIEWKRKKWNLLAKSWLLSNEIIGSNLSSCAIADHPEIKKDLRRRCIRKIETIPYGADQVLSADDSILEPLGIQKNNFFVSISRIEPENSILEIVKAASKTKARTRLIVLGNINKENKYHSEVLAAAEENVTFLGAIFDPAIVSALRFFARGYLHGHQVGGTNPSLVEALGAGCPVIAHDNKYNRWTAGDEQLFFCDVDSCVEAMNRLTEDPITVEKCRSGARARHSAHFGWNKILSEYEAVLTQHATFK